MPDYRGKNEIIIKIFQKMPSGNDIKGYHWATYRKKLSLLWFAELLKYKQPTGFDNFYRAIRIIRHYCVGHKDKRRNERPYDYDNFVAGMKPICDALKNARLIEDDKPDKLTHRRHSQEPTNDKSYVEIILFI